MATDGDGGGAGDKGDGAGGALLLPLLLSVEEDGQSVRAIETATGDVVVAGSDRETERQALWRTGESAEAGSGDNRPGSSVPEEDVHRFDDDMAARCDGQASRRPPPLLPPYAMSTLKSCPCGRPRQLLTILVSILDLDETT